MSLFPFLDFLDFDEEIIKAIHSNNQKNQEKEIEIPLLQITHNEVIKSYDKVILYLEQ